MPLNSTPSSPTQLYHEIGQLAFIINAEGLTIAEAAGADLYRFDVAECLALMQLFRTPGVANLIRRAWLAEQHAAEVGQADDDNRDKRFAGRKAA